MEDKIRELFAYNPETGEVTRKVSVGTRGKAGQPAGFLHKSSGYFYTKIDGRPIALHRIAFAVMGFDIPSFVDHINHVRTDNRWENLRPATISSNARNRSLQSNNTSGIFGVYRNQNKWVASITKKYIGRYDDFFEACCARKSAENKFGYHPNHGEVA